MKLNMFEIIGDGPLSNEEPMDRFLPGKYLFRGQGKEGVYGAGPYHFEDEVRFQKCFKLISEDFSSRDSCPALESWVAYLISPYPIVPRVKPNLPA